MLDHGYTFLETLTRAELESLAEAVPDGPGVQALREIVAMQGDCVGWAGPVA